MKLIATLSSLAFMTLSASAEVPAAIRQAVERFSSDFLLTKPTFDRATRGSRGEWRVRWDSQTVSVHPADSAITGFMDTMSSERKETPNSPVREEMAAIAIATAAASKARFPLMAHWSATLSSDLDDASRRPLWTVQGWNLREGIRGVGTEVYIGIDARNGCLSDLFWAGNYTYVSPRSTLSASDAAQRLQQRVKDKLELSSLPTVVKDPDLRWGWQVERDEFSDADLPPADLTSRESRQVYIVTVDAGEYGRVVGRVDAETGAILAGAQLASGTAAAPKTLPTRVARAPATPRTGAGEIPPADDATKTVILMGIGTGVALAGWLALRKR